MSTNGQRVTKPNKKTQDAVEKQAFEEQMASLKDPRRQTATHFKITAEFYKEMLLGLQEIPYKYVNNMIAKFMTDVEPIEEK